MNAAANEEDLHDTLVKILCLDSGGEDVRRERVIERVKTMHEVFQALHESLARIEEYESKLAGLLMKESSGDTVWFGKILSACTLLEKADEELDASRGAMKSVNGDLEAKREEVRQLRSRLSKAENTRIAERVDLMKTNLSDMDSSGPRRRASETLITAYEESERVRVTLEKEVIKLKAALDATQKNFTHNEPLREFQQLSRLEEVNRQLARQISQNMHSTPSSVKSRPPQNICFESISETFLRELEHESNEPNYTVRYALCYPLIYSTRERVAIINIYPILIY
jgi:hypothetical protein